MRYNPEIHNRRSIRLKGYDYSSNGAYFITINTQNRECFFGDIIDAEMVLNDAGRMIEKWYNELPNKFPGVELDEYVVMPDHFHCIICIDNKKNASNTVRAHLRVRPNLNQNKDLLETGQIDETVGQINKTLGQTRRSARTGVFDTDCIIENENNPNIIYNANIPRIIQWFKTMTTNEYIRGVKDLGWMPFNKKIWQRNYYEHIIRDDGELERIRNYIINNPSKWKDNKSDTNFVSDLCEIYGSEQVEESAPVGAHLRVRPYRYLMTSSVQNRLRDISFWMIDDGTGSVQKRSINRFSNMNDYKTVSVQKSSIDKSSNIDDYKTNCVGGRLWGRHVGQPRRLPRLADKETKSNINTVRANLSVRPNNGSNIQ